MCLFVAVSVPSLCVTSLSACLRFVHWCLSKVWAKSTARGADAWLVLHGFCCI